jgi:hypothetical protein
LPFEIGFVAPARKEILAK